MKVLVTGGGGFLGAEICRQLMARGHRPVSVSRNSYPYLNDMGVESFQADLSARLEFDLSGFGAVVHTAAKAGVWGPYEEFYQSNVVATENILQLAQKSGVKNFVYTSSPSVVFGKNDIAGGDESLPYPSKFLTSYAQTKALGEQIALAANRESFAVCSIRPHLIWGEGDPHLIPRLVEKARANKLRIVGGGENLVDVIHVKNAALAHVLALESMIDGPASVGGQAFFVGQERPVNLWEFINQILFQAGLEGVDKTMGFKSAYAAGMFFETLYRLAGIKSPEPPMTRFVALQLAKNHYFSQHSARSRFGYRPVMSIEEGLSQLFNRKKDRLKKISELDRR